MTDWPKITARRTINVSPWMQIIEREVEFAPGAKPELYHAVGQQDYTAIVARTPDGQIPIVRQYRPALECFTWELPAGLVDKGEAPEVCCRRELLEETGFPARSVHIAWQLCGVYGTAIEPNTFVLCRDRAALRPAGDRAGHGAQAGGAQGTRCADSGRRIRAAIAYWRPATRRHARSISTWERYDDVRASLAMCLRRC
jgi:ADP-ribose pyrophosphatase